MNETISERCTRTQRDAAMLAGDFAVLIAHASGSAEMQAVKDAISDALDVLFAQQEIAIRKKECEDIRAQIALVGSGR